MTLEANAERLENRLWRMLQSFADRRVLVGVFLVILATLSYMPGQTNLPAIDRTEGVVALASRHVVESGDVWRPRWRANVQRTRPVGTFWAQGLAVAASSTADRNLISTYRLPSLLATVLGVVLLYGLGRGIVGAPAALVAATAVAVTPIVALHAQLAIAEPLILPMTIAAQLALMAIYVDGTGQRASWWGWAGVFWIALGLSTLFNALAVPLLSLATILALCALDRSWTLIRRLRPLVGLAILGVFSLPWLMAAAAIDGGTLYKGFGWWAVIDALEGGQSMNFKTVHGVFILTLVLGFVPIAHMLGPVIGRAIRGRHDPIVRFLLVWLIVPIVALEILSNKPPLYTVQSVMPAGALLVALAFVPGGMAFLQAPALRGMFVGTCIILLVVAPALFGAVLWVTETPVTLLMLIGFAAMAALFVWSAWLSTRPFGLSWLATSLAATFLLGVWLNGVMLPGLRNFWTAPQINAVVDTVRACDPRPVAVSGFREPSLALALAGKASIGPAAAAAGQVDSGASGIAIIESRRLDPFRNKLSEGGKDFKIRRLGCVRTFNIARGCSLVFDVIAASDVSLDGACRPALQQDCQGRHDVLRDTLKIKHCE